MEINCYRRPTVKDTTFGKLFVNDIYQMYTLEDAVREIPNAPTAKWKVPKHTAIPAGRFKVEMEDSPKFGKNTITLRKVPGFDYIRVHAGNDDADTDGCPCVGFQITTDPKGDGGNISPGTSGPALTLL